MSQAHYAFAPRCTLDIEFVTEVTDQKALKSGLQSIEPLLLG